MSAAQKVSITLGSKQLELKPEDIDALAGMAANVSTAQSAGEGG
jgi:hypothetical protein